MFYKVSFTYCKTSPLPTSSSPLPTCSPLPTSSSPLPTSSLLPTSSSPLSFSPSSPMLPSFLLNNEKIKLLLITLMHHYYFIFRSLYSPLLSSPGFLPCPPASSSVSSPVSTIPLSLLSSSISSSRPNLQ